MQDDAHDDNGHGTMVASILGGTKFGVAKKVSLVALSVTNLGGGTSWSIVMAAIQWAYDDAKNNNRVGKSVINISIGGSKEADSGGALIDLTNAVVSKGLLIVVSAGNAHVSSRFSSPGKRHMMSEGKLTARPGRRKGLRPSRGGQRHHGRRDGPAQRQQVVVLQLRPGR